MKLIHPDNVLFLDFEASSLRGVSLGLVSGSDSSYPIEVGLADGAGNCYTKLIKPAPHWTDWNDDVENNVHGISRSDLAKHGQSVKDVALW